MPKLDFLMILANTNNIAIYIYIYNIYSRSTALAASYYVRVSCCFMYGLRHFMYGLRRFMYGLHRFMYGLRRFMYGLHRFMYGLRRFM